MKELICSSCGRENSLAGARFCAFCGGELIEKCSSGNAADGICVRLEKIYSDYVNWSAEYLATRPAGSVIGALFTGDRDYKARDEHDEFAGKCQEFAGQLCEGTEAGAPHGRLMELLNYVFFDVYSLCGDEAAWMLMACEKFYIPLLDKLSDDELSHLYSRYKNFRKRRMMLPAQEEILKKMKKLSKNKS